MNKQDFRQIYKCVFDDGAEWCRWFFDEVVDDDSHISIGRDASGKADACLLMQEYPFLFHGSVLPSEYMSCVATLPNVRRQGLAGALITQSLGDAAARGAALCCLIPAEDHLYFYYSRFGFASTFYVNRERYTALHQFAGCPCVSVEPSPDTFIRLERSFGCGVLHDRLSFSRIMTDNRLDGGCVIQVRSEADGSEAVLFSLIGDKSVTVKCILADNEDIATAALAELRKKAGELPVTVVRPPLSSAGCFLRPFGMCRVLNPQLILEAIAAAHPGLRYALRLTDPLLPANSGVYTLRDGECRRPQAFGGHIDLECSIDTFAAAIFSTERISRILDLPARRPYMTLMLD